MDWLTLSSGTNASRDTHGDGAAFNRSGSARSARNSSPPHYDTDPKPAVPSLNDEPGCIKVVDTFRNVATRLESFVVKGGAYAYGSYPDIDALYEQQAVELDRNTRQEILTKIQQLVREKAIFAPIFQLAFINAVGPRIDESGFGLIKAFAYTAPYEDLTLKGA